MEVGDSFLVPLDGKAPAKARSWVAGAAAYYCKRNRGRRFVTRVLPEGIGCWRIEYTPKPVSIEQVAAESREREERRKARPARL